MNRRSSGSLLLSKAIGGFIQYKVQHYARLAEIDIEQAHQRASPADNWRL